MLDRMDAGLNRIFHPRCAMRMRGDFTPCLFCFIHGGANSLRFTPHFAITSEEADLLVEGVRQALLEGPRKSENVRAAAA